MKYWPALTLLPILAFGFFLGTLTDDSKRTVKVFVDMRLPANTDAEYNTRVSREIDEEDIGAGNFLFNARLNRDESSWGIESKTFFINDKGDLKEICEHLSSQGGEVLYTLEAEGVAIAGEKISIEISKDCTDFEFIELLPFEFCSVDFSGFKSGFWMSESSDFKFINFSDFMPKTWFLESVQFIHEDDEQGQLIEKVHHNSSEPIVFSCFES